MGFGKAFGLGLLTYLLLNLGLFVVVMAIISPAAIGAIFSSFEMIMLAMLLPVAVPGGFGFIMLGTIGTLPGMELFVLFMGIWLILPGVIGALVAGKSGESAGASFGGWLLAPIVASVIAIVIGLIIPAFNLSLLATAFLSGSGLLISSGTLLLLLSGLTNGLIWGGIAAVVAGP